jgi:lathosterol oxidase
MIEIALFFLWTLMLYGTHRLAHIVPGIKEIHWDHHKHVTMGEIKGWHWSNFFLWNDSWLSTVDLWILEVIPTLIFCYVFNCWWLFVLYWLWGALIQEAIEHNPKVNLYPWCSSGQWHLHHHHHPNKNFGVFTPLWDKLFGTNSADHRS